MGISRLEINEEMRRFVYRYHIVFYKIISEHQIRIERIIHGGRDITNQFYRIVIFKYCQCGSMGLSSSTSWMVLSIGYTLNTISLSDIQKESETLELTAQD
jgi:hypothetical protein